MNSDRGDRGGRGRRGRPRPARRGGRPGPKAARSASPPTPAAVLANESVKFASNNDVAQLQRVWPVERERILNLPASFNSRTPDFQAKETWNPVAAAAQQNAIEALEYLLNNGGELDSHFSSAGLTPLASAAANGQDEAAQYLLARGASPITPGRCGATALHMAAGAGNIPLLESFLVHPNADINVLDERDQSPLHYAALGSSVAAIKLLLQRGAAITHDKRGFSPLFYAYEKYNSSKRGQAGHPPFPHGHRRRGKQQSPSASSDPASAEITLELAYTCPFLYETFRVVLDRNLRETIVRRLGPDRILQVLALRLEAQEDTELFNEILLTLCRTLKNDKQPLVVAYDGHFGQVLQLMVTESNVSTLQSLGSVLAQPNMLQHLSVSLLDKLAAALEISCRMCLFGHQPFGDYAVDFLFNMMPVFLRLALGLTVRSDAGTVAALNAIGARFDRYWDLLQDCLQDIDFNVQESERFAALIYAFFHHRQVFPLNAEVLNYLTHRHESTASVMPKLSWFLEKRPVSARFQDFYEARTAPIRHIAEDCEDAFFKYFRHSVRVGGLVTKAHFIQALANRQTVDMKAVSINRFLLSGTDSQSHEAYEFFVQQMLTVPARAYTVNLQIDFLHEPGIGEGPLRELIQIVSKRLFTPSPSNVLFRVAPSGSCYHLASVRRDLSIDHLNLHWELAGRVVGLSLTTMFPLGVRLSTPLLSRMLDKPVTSLEGFDDDLHKHLQWLRSNSLDTLDLGLRFTATDPDRGEDVSLISGGADRAVTDDNKEEFIKSLMEYRLWGTPADKALSSSFIKGFQDVLPKQALTMLTPSELGDLLQGSQKLDLEWMRTHLVTYSYGFTIDSPVVQWFWQYMESLSAEKQAQMLQFWSGSPVPPLPDSPYTDPWSITPHLRPITSLPSSATCTRQLSIPRYTSYEQLERKFNTVLELGYVGYSNTFPFIKSELLNIKLDRALSAGGE